ncbi:hypothetical protein C2G38_2223689 [Gigaspora rosea]|uniref:EIF2B subunit epsilon/gamma LbH domain-containing protein n=1 Tax=Gigaspora rosea TaxID=44941 RepID=A0A397UA14_9GLOM|nr:hypothetical protein C2G38_2223689 [Gigaspora rosea]
MNEGKLKPNLEVVKENVGTADVLRIFSEKIKAIIALFEDPKQFVGVDTNKSRIVYVASSADLEEEFLYACHYYGKINSKAQVESDSLVGDDTKIDERTSIKRSTIGIHCTIGNNVKISKSILMDNIVIEDKYVLFIAVFKIVEYDKY